MDKIEKYYLHNAEEIVNALFEKGYFRDDVTRQEMKAIDEWIAYLIQTNVKSGISLRTLTEKAKKL